MSVDFLMPELGWFGLRLAVGIVFLAHGPLKVARAAKLAGMMGLPVWFVRALGAGETLGALALILGVYVQAGALVLMAVMAGAIYMKSQVWNKSFTGEGGWEFEFTLLAALTAILLESSGYTLF